jgi:hypothetical protein
MKQLAKFALVTSTLLAFPAYAMSQTASEIDTNGDGVLTMDEVQATMPDITSETFAAMDQNADGALDEGEVSAAQGAGLMPPSDG